MDGTDGVRLFLAPAGTATSAHAPPVAQGIAEMWIVNRLMHIARHHYIAHRGHHAHHSVFYLE
jgi:hypothetical protein